MTATNAWMPFSNMDGDESPFNFNLAATAMRNAIQLAWMATPEWSALPIRIENLDKMEKQMRTLLDELLKEAREDAGRRSKGNAPPRS